jgi:hypothetical protein
MVHFTQLSEGVVAERRRWTFSVEKNNKRIGPVFIVIVFLC